MSVTCVKYIGERLKLIGTYLVQVWECLEYDLNMSGHDKIIVEVVIQQYPRSQKVIHKRDNSFKM